jgi:hypothetical protein
MRARAQIALADAAGHVHEVAQRPRSLPREHRRQQEQHTHRGHHRHGPAKRGRPLARPAGVDGAELHALALDVEADRARAAAPGGPSREDVLAARVLDLEADLEVARGAREQPRPRDGVVPLRGDLARREALHALHLAPPRLRVRGGDEDDGDDGRGHRDGHERANEEHAAQRERMPSDVLDVVTARVAQVRAMRPHAPSLAPSLANT